MKRLSFHLVVSTLVVALLLLVSPVSKSQDSEVNPNATDQSLSIWELLTINSHVDFRIMTGMRYLSYSDAFFDKDKLTDNSPFGGIGITIGVGKKILLDGYFQYTDKGKDGYFLTNDAEIDDAQFNREDYVGTLTYIIPLPSWFERHSFSVFGGYKKSQTDLTANVTKLPPGIPPLSRQEVTFETYGPFFGVGYSWKPFKNDESNLTFNVAWGWDMKGDYTFSAFRGEKRDSSDNAVNPTSGFRYGIYWNGPLTKFSRGRGKLTYTISLDGYEYKMDLKQEIAGRSMEGKAVEEAVYGINASVNYVYDF